jgi:hypothetical protein
MYARSPIACVRYVVLKTVVIVMRVMFSKLCLVKHKDAT